MYENTAANVMKNIIKEFQSNPVIQCQDTCTYKNFNQKLNLYTQIYNQNKQFRKTLVIYWYII